MVTPSCLRDDAVERRVNAAQLVRKLFVHLLARGQQPVETLAALVLLAPLTAQEPLAFEPPQQRVERALVDLQPGFFQGLAQRVAVPLGPKLIEDCERQAPSPQLEPQVLEGSGARAVCTVSHILCVAQCTPNRWAASRCGRVTRRRGGCRRDGGAPYRASRACRRGSYTWNWPNRDADRTAGRDPRRPRTACHRERRDGSSRRATAETGCRTTSCRRCRGCPAAAPCRRQ